MLTQTNPLIVKTICCHPYCHHSQISQQRPSRAVVVVAATAPHPLPPPPRRCSTTNSSSSSSSPTFSMASPSSLYNIFVLLLLLLFAFHAVAVDETAAVPESDALLNFKGQLKNQGGSVNSLSSWDTATKPCSGESKKWAGVICADDSVRGLQLENMGLGGQVLLDPLKNLSNFRTLSLMNNALTGPIPNVSLLPALKSVYLSGNRFSGAIPETTFVDARFLKKLHLANNNFSGQIPRSLAKLPRLLELRLENNRFVGSLPDLGRVQSVNVSTNNLAGMIPTGLSKTDPTSFIGNEELCGPPLKNLCPSPPPAAAPATESKESKPRMRLSRLMIALAVVAAFIALMVIGAAVGIILKKRRRSSASHAAGEFPNSLELPMTSRAAAGRGKNKNRKKAGEGGGGGGAKLTFVGAAAERFALADLLGATAEILGTGWFGASYKAALVGGPVMVVKRFTQMNNVDKEEFQEHMATLGRLSHPNLLPIVAYYYRKDEKLIVTDIVPNGSLDLRLHGKTINEEGQATSLDWPSRLNIVKGVAKGLAYLYTELPNLITPHGHLKSSNVLLSPTLSPIITDYALGPLINQENAQHVLLAYKSPEYRKLNRLTKKTDVWSLGILILELLTRKSLARLFHQNDPAGGTSSASIEPSGGRDGDNDDDDSDSDLSSWVASVAAQLEGPPPGRVFDELMGRGSEGEMVKLLRIGVECCQEDVEKRWDIREAAERIMEVREFDEEFYSSRSFRDMSDVITPL